MIGKPKKNSGRLRGSVRCRLTVFANRLLELNPRENACSLDTNGKEGPRIDTQGFEDGRRHLRGSYPLANRPGLEARMREQQNDIRVVMGEPAMFCQFRSAAGVSNADVWCHDDVR